MSNDNKIDMSLNDIIKRNRRSAKGGATRRGSKGAGGEGGATRRGSKGAAKGNAVTPGIKGGRGGASRRGAPLVGSLRGAVPRGTASRGGVRRRAAPLPYVRSTQVPDVWKHDLYESVNQSTRSGLIRRGAPQSGPGASPRGCGTGTILISNLHFGVTESDITELFSKFGRIKKSAIRYDKSGRSLETAEVVYENTLSASKARTHYNDVPLDGKPMKITIVGGEESPSPAERTIWSRLGPVPIPQQPRGEMIQQSRGGYGDGQQRGRFGGRGGGRGGNRRRGGGAGGENGKVVGGENGRGAARGSGRGATDGSRRGAAASSFGGRDGPRRGRSGARNASRKIVSKEVLDAQLDAYKMESD